VIRAPYEPGPPVSLVADDRTANPLKGEWGGARFASRRRPPSSGSPRGHPERARETTSSANRLPPRAVCLASHAAGAEDDVCGSPLESPTVAPPRRIAAPLASDVVGMVVAGGWSDRSGAVRPLAASLVLFSVG